MTLVKDPYDFTCIDTDDKKGLKLKVAYSAYLHKFKVSVSYKGTEKNGFFVASFEPRFGMDVIDHGQAMKMADDFAEEIERQYGI